MISYGKKSGVDASCIRSSSLKFLLKWVTCIFVSCILYSTHAIYIYLRGLVTDFHLWRERRTSAGASDCNLTDWIRSPILMSAMTLTRTGREYANLILTHLSSFYEDHFNPLWDQLLNLFHCGLLRWILIHFISPSNVGAIGGVVVGKEAIMGWLLILLRAVAGWNLNEVCYDLLKWGCVILTSGWISPLTTSLGLPQPNWLSSQMHFSWGENIKGT